MKRRVSFTQRRVLITGAAGGIGRQLALEFSAAGAALVLWDVNGTGLAETVAQLPPERVASASCVDVGDAEAVAAAARDAGSVDVVISNAGVVLSGDVEHLGADAVTRAYDVNVGAAFSLIRAFLPAMRARNEGCVVLVASVMGLVGSARLGAYCASKWALLGLSESLRMELHRDGRNGVSVVTVAPYLVGDSLMFKGAFAGDASAAGLLRAAVFPPVSAASVARATLAAVAARRDAVLVLPWHAHAALLALRALPLFLADALVGSMGGWHGMAAAAANTQSAG